LPAAYNPERGFLVSTNNIPVRTDPALSIFGNSNDRWTTITRFLGAKSTLSVADLKSIQTDVYSGNSHALARAISALAPPPTPDNAQLLMHLQDWDGTYTIDSKGAAALELIAYHFASNYYKQRYGEPIADYLRRSPAVYTFIRQDLAESEALPPLMAAIEAAAKDFSTYPTWGKLHVLRLRHPLGNLPLIGGKYRFGDHPVPGSTNTVNKSAHPLSHRPHFVTYGANARHISDLSDQDENYFVLLGGQDGFWGSANFVDLFDLWQKGKYVRVPLRLESVRSTFEHQLIFNP
jgi:penicillin amidase